MPEGQFNIPNITIPTTQESSEPEIQPYRFSRPLGNQVYFSPSSYNVNPALYELDKVALQSGLTNWVNSFIQGLNQTQISGNQFGLFQNQKRIAEIEGGLSYKGELKDLESSYLSRSIDEVDYLQQKEKLLDELQTLYLDNSSIKDEILSDEADIEKAPVSKSFQVRQQLLQGMGSDAGFLDQVQYSLPSVAGSSAATLGATLIAGFGADFIKKLTTRAAGSLMTGPAAGVVATGTTIATLGSLLYYARDLESQAEVGGAIAEDLERLTQDYLLRTNKQEAELTPEEQNELMTQAYQGSEGQYWKNMSLAAVDALQSILLAGNVGKWFERISNINKFTRLGSTAGSLYLSSKSEALEEGLQFAFQKEKNNAANNPNYVGNSSAYYNGLDGFLSTVVDKDFINSIRLDYADVLSSMSYGPIKGNGKYSEDPEFQFSTDAGFLMGLFTGGGAGVYRTAKDLVNYKQAAAELQKAGIENAEGNAFKFNTALYKSFFQPSKGLFGSDGNDRVHYLREGIKALGRKKDANGEVILTQQEVQTELQNITQAYNIYNNLNEYVDTITAPFDRKQAKLVNLAKAKFKDATFTQAMQEVFNKKKLASATRSRETAKLTIDPQYSRLVDLKSQLDTINSRIARINNLEVGEKVRKEKISFLDSKAKGLKKAIEEEETLLKDAGISVTNTPPTPPALVGANEEFLTSEMFTEESSSKYNNLLRIRSRKGLLDWFKGAVEDEFNAGLTAAVTARQETNQEDYRTMLANRPQYDLLTVEEERDRQAQNKKILADEGFTRAEIDALGYESLETIANEILTTYAGGDTYINRNLQYRVLAQVKTREQFKALFNNPTTSKFLTDTFPGTTADSDFTSLVEQAKSYLQTQVAEQPKKPLEPAPTGTYTSIGRRKMATDTRTSDDIRNELGLPGLIGQVDQETVLNNIINSPYATAAEKALARELLKVTESDDIIEFSELGYAGSYDSETNSVNVDLRFVGSDYVNSDAALEVVILHELIHKYTVESIKQNPDSELSKRLRNLYNFAVEQARSKNVFDKFYGLKDPFEFLTESMLNLEFQEFLKGLSYDLQKRTAWEEFLSLVNAALRALGVNTSQTALDEAISITSGLVGLTNRESFSSIRARIEPQINTEINVKNNLEQNETAAKNLYKELYDLNLSPAEFNILKQLVDERLASVNSNKKASDQYKFGKWTLEKGNFVVPVGKNYVYTFVSQNKDNSIIVSYEFQNKETNEKQTASRVINDPSEIADVFSNRTDAFNFIKGRQPVKSKETKPVSSDSFGDALNNFVNYSSSKNQYGSIDPKLIELGNALIREAIKIGRTNFSDISSEIIARVGEDKYKEIFNNLRQVYTALFADYNRQLTDSEGEMTNLVMGRTTADSMINLLEAKEEPDNNSYTGGTANPQQEIALSKQNIDDKISGELLKSVGQQFKVDENNKWTTEVDDDPVKVRYYNFLNRLLSDNSNVPVYGTLYQDGDTLPDGTPIPHEQSTIRYYEKQRQQGKPIVYGQVVVVTDAQGRALRFNQEGQLSESGDLIVFNLESVVRISDKNVSIVARENGMTEEQAKVAIERTAKTVEGIRNSAKSGKPVLLNLKPKKGVPVFLSTPTSTEPLVTQNVEIEIPTVQKDSSNIGYFERHPNKTGFLGGAYMFINDIPVKIEPNRLSESAVDLILAILDEQVSSKLDQNEIAARSKFLKDLVFQRYSKDAVEGTFYFSNSDVYINGAKVPKDQRRAALLTNGRFNISSRFLNKNWRPYTIKDGKVVRGEAVKYNSHVLLNSTSLAAINSGGQQLTANSYFTFSVNKQIEPWVKPTAKSSKPSAFLSEPYKAPSNSQGRPVPITTILSELDPNENPGGLDTFIEAAQEVRLLNLTIDEEGNREGTVYIDRGDTDSSGSTKMKVVFTKITPTSTNASVETSIATSDIKATPSSAKNDILNKLRAQNAKDKVQTESIDKDVKAEMDSLAKPKKFYYGKVDSVVDTLGVTKSLVVVRSIDRLIYDFIHSYDRSIVETLNQPKILAAAYKFAYTAFKNNTIDLRNEYIEKIEKAPEDKVEALVAELDSKLDKFNQVTSNWNELVNYHREHSRTFVIRDEQIRFAFDESGNLIEENDDTDANRAKNSFEALAGNEISSIDGANKETKALIRGLGKAEYNNGVITPVYNEFGIQELVDFGSTWNNLALTLEGTMEFDQMLSKIEIAIPSFPEYRELLDILSDRTTLDVDKVSQLAKFRQDFSRTYVGIYELVFDPVTNTYKFLESTKSNVEAIRSEYKDNFITSPSSKYITKDQVGNNYLTKAILDLKTDSVEDRIKFLSILGIKFSEGTFKDKDFSDAVSGRAVSALKNSLSKMINAGVPVTDPITQLATPNPNLGLPGEAGNINKMLLVESRHNRVNATASMLNAGGSTVYALSLNNLLTISNSYLSDFTNYPTYQDIIGLPHMKHLDFHNNPYVKNSIWLNQMFELDENSPTFGQRKTINGQPVVIELINYNGLKVEVESGASEGDTTTNLWIGDKLVQDFNATLVSGVKEMMRAGDKSSAFAVKLSGYGQVEGREDKLPVRIEEFSSGFGGDGAFEILQGYLEDELTRIKLALLAGVGSDLDYYEGTAKKFNLFKGILSEATQDSMYKDIQEGVEISTILSKNQHELKNSLRDFFNKQVQDKISRLESYSFSFKAPHWVDKNLRDRYDLSQLLRAYVVNAFIINVEQTKIFNGDGAFYKAFHKRNSKDSSTGTTMMTDIWFINWLNDHPNTNLQSKLLGVNNQASNVTNTVIFEDNNVASVYADIYRNQLKALGLKENEIESIASKYEKANEGDAQGWITLDFYRTFKLAQGKWYPEHEEIYRKASTGQELSPEELFFFMPIKAQYAGPLDYSGAFAPAFHKFSLVPLIPGLIKGTKLESLNEKMIRNNVGYGLFESGSKVATIVDSNGKKDNFYSDYKNRVPVDPSTAFKSLNPVFNHYLKEQVNIEPALHDENIFGTQFRKLLFQNLFNEGKALDARWEKLYEEYSHVIAQLVKNEKQRLLEELGIEEINENEYKNVDFQKLVDKFNKEARRRDMNENVLSYMSYDPSKNNFSNPLDASISRQQIQNMIMSIINNRLVRQKVSGDLMVQVSGAGFEKYEKPTDLQIDQYGTNGLRFYHLKDGKTQSMQVKVPLNGDFSNLLYYIHPDGQPIQNINRLNEALKDEAWVEENRKSITMIGYRIPTQGLNSMEFMEIAEFLPPEAGNILILPTEIVIKAGSDFDIDKLSIFKPSIRTRYRIGPNGDKIIEKASYTVPKDRNLSKSVEAQKQELKEEYDPKILDLKNKLTKLKDDKTLDVRWLVEQKRKLREQLGDDVANISERFFDVQYKLRELGYSILFKNDEIEKLAKEASIEGLNPETSDLLTGLKLELQDLILERNLTRIELDEIRASRNSAYVSKTALIEEADRLIQGYLDDFYKNEEALRKELDVVLTDYFNQIEELKSFKKGLQNRIIEIGREVLEDQVNFIQLITPNDTGLIKPMITDPGGLKQQNGYPLKTDYTGTAIYTERTQEEKFLAGLVGKKALGIAAVNNTFTQLFEIIGLHVNAEYSEKIGKNHVERKVFMRLLDKVKDSSYDFSKVLDEEGVLKSEFVSQMINAYVDVLNDDFIFYANAGLDVAPVIFYLKNAGVSTEKIFYLINHPVVKFYVNNVQFTKSYVLKSIYPETYNNEVAIANNTATYKSRLVKDLLGYRAKEKAAAVDAGNISAADKHPNFFNKAFLKSRVSLPLEKISYDERKAILGYFLQVQNQANMLRKFQSGNSYDTSTAASPIESENFRKLQNEVSDSGFIDNKYQTAIGNTVIKPFNVTGFVSEMFDSLMPITLGKERIQRLLDKLEGIDPETQDRYARIYTNDLPLYIFSNYVTLDLPGNPTISDYVLGGRGYNSMFAFTEGTTPDGKRVKMDSRISNRVITLKNNAVFKSLRDEFPIIDQLRILPSKREDGFTNVTIYRGENTTDTQNSLIEQFSKLANLEDPSLNEKQINFVRKLFRDLALFGFIQSGLNKSPISYTDIIPNDLYTPLMSKAVENYKLRRSSNAAAIDKEYDSLFSLNNPELYGIRNSLPSYKFKNYRSQSLQNPVKNLINTDEVIEELNSNTPTATISMQPKNIDKILAGTKTTTTRSTSQASAIGIPIGEQAVVKFGNKSFYVRNRGALSIEEAGGKPLMLSSEGVSSESEFSYQQTRDWINGKGKLFVYDISQTPFQGPSQPNLFTYGNLSIQPENRILDSRNSYTNSEIDEVLTQFTEQSKPCNS